MSINENKNLIRQFFVEENNGNFGVYHDLCAPNFAFHIPGIPEPLNREGSEQFARAFYTAFPDLRHTVEDQIAEGDKVVTRMTLNGTHKGDFQGIPATGKSVTMTGIVINRIAGGKFVEGWVNLDALGMMQQLGVVPMPESAGA